MIWSTNRNILCCFSFHLQLFSEASEGHTLNGLPWSVLLQKEQARWGGSRGRGAEWSLLVLLVTQGDNKWEKRWAFLNGTNWIALTFYRATNCFSYASARFVCFLMSFAPSLESRRCIWRRKRLKFAFESKEFFLKGRNLWSYFKTSMSKRGRGFTEAFTFLYGLCLWLQCTVIR